MSGSIRRTDLDSVVLLTIERPERRNALDAPAVAELHRAVDAIDPTETRVLVMTGADGHFCAGADLTTTEDPEFTVGLRAMLDALAGLPMPTVAAISGACMGLGMQLALSVDLRVATEDALFAVPVARLGLLTDHSTLERLVATVGWGAARAMVLAAERIDAERATTLGLVQRSGDLDDALEWAADMARLAPLSQRGGKLGLDLVDAGASDPKAYRDAFEAAWASDDLEEGRLAFTERRPAEFRGR